MVAEVAEAVGALSGRMLAAEQRLTLLESLSPSSSLPAPPAPSGPSNPPRQVLLGGAAVTAAAAPAAAAAVRLREVRASGRVRVERAGEDGLREREEEEEVRGGVRELAREAAVRG